MPYSKKVLGGIYKRVSAALSGMAGIDIKIGDDLCPAYDPENKFIQMPSKISWADNEDEAFELGRGSCVHEASHVLFLPRQQDIQAAGIMSCMPKDVEQPTEGGYDHEDYKDFMEWLNVFADCNNEYRTSQLWPHLKSHLAKKSSKFIEKNPGILKTKDPFIQVLLRCDVLIPDLQAKVEFPDKYPGEVIEFIEQTSKEFLEGGFIECSGTDLLEFNKQIFHKWKKLKQDFKRENSMNPDIISKLMKAIGKAISDGNKEAQSKLEQQVRAERNKQNKMPERDEKHSGMIVTSDKGGTGEFAEASMEDLRRKLNERTEEKLNTTPGWGDSDIEDPKDLRQVEPDGDACDNIDIKAAYKEGREVYRALKRQVNLQEDFETRHQNGRIDLTEVRNQVAKAGRIISSSVFKRLNDFSRGGEWAISVLIDCSGSMEAGNKMRDAKQALATLAYALDGLPNVHYEFIGFTQDECPLDIVVKSYRERRINFNRLKSLYAANGNADGINLRASIKRINKFRNMKKVIIVISDGQPAYHFKDEDGILDMQKLVQKAINIGVNIIGIGIPGCSKPTLEQIYPVHYMFNNTANLDKDLTKLILNALRKKSVFRPVLRAWERIQ